MHLGGNHCWLPLIISGICFILLTPRFSHVLKGLLICNRLSSLFLCLYVSGVLIIYWLGKLQNPDLLGYHNLTQSRYLEKQQKVLDWQPHLPPPHPTTIPKMASVTMNPHFHKNETCSLTPGSMNTHRQNCAGKKLEISAE